MRDALALFFAIVVIGLLLLILREHRPQQTLPLIQVAAPNHGFVCTPAITPRLGQVRTRNWT